jgi:HAE1 family hydrophobic/amphiphilic exporter-1
VKQSELRGAGLSITDVSDAIAAANMNFPGGTIKESFYEYLVRTIGEFKHVDEVGNIPIKSQNDRESEDPYEQQKIDNEPSNRLVYLKDVADVKRTVKERTNFSRFNLLENVTLSIQKQAQANTIQVSKLIRKKLSDLEEQLPKDIKVDVVYDQSKFIREALDGVKDAAMQGGFLAFLVLVIFLRDFKNSALVVTITPVTVLATYTLMYFMGISLNVISLGGVALGVGMLLDNAVVVIENVYRRYREHPLKSAAAIGSNEVMAPMVASTLTTVSVFLPIVFVTGIAGQIFKELAWVVVVTQVISAIIAFTLLPMLIAKVGEKSSLTKRDIHDEAPAAGHDPSAKATSLWGIWNELLEKALNICSIPVRIIEKGYEKVLPGFLAAKWLFLFIITLIFVGSLFVFMSMDKILLPKVDQGQFMVKVDLPVGSRVEYTDQISQRIERYIKSIPSVKSVAAIVGSSKGESSKDVLERLGSQQAQIVVTIKPESKVPTDLVVQEVRRYFELSEGRKLITPARIGYVLYDSAFKVGGENDAPIVIDIKGPKLDELKALALETQDKLSKIPGTYGVGNSIAEPFPETKITIDKDRASFYRLSVVTIAQAANIAIKGATASKFKEEGKEINIRVQLKEADRDRFSKLGSLMIRSPLDLDVPLSDFVKFQRGLGPSEIKRVSQERTVQVFSKIYGRGLEEVVHDVQDIVSKMKVPERYAVKLAGESEEVKESFNSLQFAFMLSIVLVYMIMAAQFESLYQPFLIMFCLPLSLIGVAAALWISHTPISVVVILGIILLAGIVVNNGIILIDYINQLRKGGMGLEEAAILAGKTRLRPILMTAFSSAIGLAPLALGLGEGAELQAPMAVAVMGGILMATFLTLVVTPSLYIGVEEIADLIFRREKKTKANAAALESQ